MFILHDQRKDPEVIRSADNGSVIMLAQLQQQWNTKRRRNFRKQRRRQPTHFQRHELQDFKL